MNKENPFILPHESSASIFHERRCFFERHVRGTDQQLETYWDELSDHNFIRSNPVVRDCADHKTTAVPLGLHGNAGMMSKQKSVLVLTWNSLVGQGTSKQTRHVMTLIKKDEMLSDGATLHAIWDVLS